MLLPALLSTFDEAFAVGQLPDSMGEAAIIVIPKKVKDPSLLHSLIGQFLYYHRC